MGVDCFKTDFGERIPTDVVWSDGSDPERMHNYYSYLYNRACSSCCAASGASTRPWCSPDRPPPAVSASRSTGAGTASRRSSSMAESLRGGLSLAASGFGFWSHDIGGFEGRPDPAVFKRWIPFGLLCTHSRLHGSDSYRVPWLFDEESVEVLRTVHPAEDAADAVPLRAGGGGEPDRSAGAAADGRGVPRRPGLRLSRPAVHAGRSLLVAPVFTASGETSYYLPAGDWTHLQTGATVSGPGWVHEECDFGTVPVYVRPGSVLPIGARDDRPDYAYAEASRCRRTSWPTVRR